MLQVRRAHIPPPSTWPIIVPVSRPVCSSRERQATGISRRAREAAAEFPVVAAVNQVARSTSIPRRALLAAAGFAVVTAHAVRMAMSGRARGVAADIRHWQSAPARALFSAIQHSNI